MRFLWLLLIGGRAAASPLHCEDLETGDLSIDGILDEWPRVQAVHVGASGGNFKLRCAWDGKALAVALDVEDDRVVRVARGHEDHVDISVKAGGKPTTIVVFPGNAMAKPKRVVPAGAQAADSSQPKGFSIEARIPTKAIAGFSSSTGAIELSVVFHDSDAAAGGADAEIPFAGTIELSNLLDDFLKATRLARKDLVLDTMVDLDPDRRGKERLVAGGSVIGVLTDQFGYVNVAGDVKKVSTIALGNRNIVAAIVAQKGNGGGRELLMLWAVWSGQLTQLAQVEVKKEQGKNVLAAEWKVVGKELVVAAKPAVGWTKETWNEEPATDADPIPLPWEKRKLAYKLTGNELSKRELK